MAWIGTDPQALLGQELSMRRGPEEFLGRYSKLVLQTLPASQGIFM